MLFKKLRVWRDVIDRHGPENMAIDEWLMTQAVDGPILRLYHWKDDWVSYGYFHTKEQAKAIFGDEVRYVRRWTGGGVVDHRVDATYTLAIPRHEELASRRGSESYCLIHQALAECLKSAGVAANLIKKNQENNSLACFEAPVCWDLMGETEEKIAGAGQRRGRLGMLHQGSVAADSREIANLPDFLADDWSAWKPADQRLWMGYLDRYF